jgi:hypothetical protein
MPPPARPAEEEELTTPPPAAVRASSTLQRNARLYGPALMFDGGAESCWNSDSGSPQWLEVTLAAPAAALTALELTFQGGFVGQDCDVFVAGDGEGGGQAWVHALHFEPDDVNAPQRFAVPPPSRPSGGKDAPPPAGVARVRLVFGRSTDFYGRVTVYRLALYGVR